MSNKTYLTCRIFLLKTDTVCQHQSGDIVASLLYMLQQKKFVRQKTILLLLIY